MNLIYKNTLEESNANLTDFDSEAGYKILKEQGFYKIIWAMADVKEMMIDGCAFELKKDQVVFCTPLNFIDIPRSQKEVWAFVFNREFYCIRDNDEEVSCNGLLFYGTSQPIVIDLDEKEQKMYKEIYDIFKEEFKNHDSSYGEMLRIMLKRLIIKSTRLAKNIILKSDISPEKIDFIRQFHVLVEQNYKTHHQVKDYAELLHRSPKTLSNIFKKYDHDSPLKCINERILLESRRLLLFSNKTSEEIGYELGYSDIGHFSKFFKQNMCCSPLQFKKNALSWHKGNNVQS